MKLGQGECNILSREHSVPRPYCSDIELCNVLVLCVHVLVVVHLSNARSIETGYAGVSRLGSALFLAP